MPKKCEIPRASAEGEHTGTSLLRYSTSDSEGEGITYPSILSGRSQRRISRCSCDRSGVFRVCGQTQLFGLKRCVMPEILPPFGRQDGGIRMEEKGHDIDLEGLLAGGLKWHIGVSSIYGE